MWPSPIQGRAVSPCSFTEACRPALIPEVSSVPCVHTCAGMHGNFLTKILLVLETFQLMFTVQTQREKILLAILCLCKCSDVVMSQMEMEYCGLNVIVYCEHSPEIASVLSDPARYPKPVHTSPHSKVQSDVIILKWTHHLQQTRTVRGVGVFFPGQATFQKPE